MSLFVLMQNEQMRREWEQFADEVAEWEVEMFKQKFSSDDPDDNDDDDTSSPASVSLPQQL